MAAVNSCHWAGVKVRAGPVGSLESRTETISPEPAIIWSSAGIADDLAPGVAVGPPTACRLPELARVAVPGRPCAGRSWWAGGSRHQIGGIAKRRVNPIREKKRGTFGPASSCLVNEGDGRWQMTRVGGAGRGWGAGALLAEYVGRLRTGVLLSGGSSGCGPSAAGAGPMPPSPVASASVRPGTGVGSVT